MKSIRLMVAAFAAFLSLGSAHAALTPFQLFTGTVGLSSDGWGSTTQSGVISANVPLGATVTAAYLYTSTFDNVPLTGVGGTIAGNAHRRVHEPRHQRDGVLLVDRREN